MLPAFANEPLTNFTDKAHREAYEAALARLRDQAGSERPLRVGGRDVVTPTSFESRNPARWKDVVSRHASARPEDVEAAIQASVAGFERWREVPYLERASVLVKAAAIMRRRKHELSALMTLEVGKPWAEADADTAEAIDFCEFYAREMLRYGGEQPVTPQPGELCQVTYLPLGTGVVIPPWNFPLAITAGMTVASLVAGNTVVLKPSSDAPAIAAALVDVLDEAGVPGGALSFVTGGGGAIGDQMVDHPKVRFISFTGSREVGTRIYERAAKVHSGQRWLKRVVAEMGGKDAIVVDSDTDLKAAAAAVVASAFGFSGQKCSACSRLIVVDSVHDELLHEVVRRTGELKVGDPSRPDTQVGPVVNEKAFRRIMEHVDAERKAGRVVAGGEGDSDKGWFVQPTVVDGVREGERLFCDELFGPVLAVTRAKDFEDGLRLANASEYGLTGAAWSRDRERLAMARERFHVGNLYLNRKSTGAMVGGHPFGGFDMSGTDSKAGGRDYMLLYLQAKSIAEKF